MTTFDQIPPAVSVLCADVRGSKAGATRLKLRTLLGKFGYSKRSDSNTAEITQMLSEAGIALNPPIVRRDRNFNRGRSTIRRGYGAIAGLASAARRVAACPPSRSCARSAVRPAVAVRGRMPAGPSNAAVGPPRAPNVPAWWRGVGGASSCGSRGVGGRAGGA